MKRLIAALAILVMSVGVAAAQSGGMKDMDAKGVKSDKKNQVHKATGTVTKVDSAKGAITLAHAPVASMNWPAMTMTFGVKDKSLLDKAKQGAKVEFSFVESGRDYVITDIK